MESSDPPPLDPAADALFLDFDGTLAEIVAHPDDARLGDHLRDRLIVLSERFGGAVAVLSGRALADLTVRVPEALWRAGGHGAETAAPGESAAAEGVPDPALVAAAEAVARRHKGVLVEIKPGGVALHYRQNPAAEADSVAAMERAVAADRRYELQRGKMVIEAKPAGADKGAALRALMERPPFRGRRPVMVGDDLTDEPAMRAALELGGLAVKIGEGASVAPSRLASPEAVYAWLLRSLGET